MALADVRDLMDRFDVRILCNLATDSDIPVQPGDLPTHPRAVAWVNDAIGELKAAIEVGNKYSQADIELLETTQDPYVVSVVIGLALKNAYASRNTMDDAPAQAFFAMQACDKLRTGERVFAVQRNRDAGNVQFVEVSVSERDELNLISDRYRFFPRGQGNC